MAECHAIRKAFRKWWAENFIEILDSVVMFYVGMVLLTFVWALFIYFNG